MYRGYIKLWRSSVDNDLYFAEPFTKWQAWTDLLLLANHQPNTIGVRGNLVSVDRGQVAAGEDYLAKRWKWSRGKVRRFMGMLRDRGQTVQQKSHILSIYTITNWDLYQPDNTTDSTTESQQKANRQTTPKNVKNVENEKKGEGSAASLASEKPIKKIFTPPTQDELKILLKRIKTEKNLELGGTVALTLIERYLTSRSESEWIKANGKPVKNWKSDFRTWIGYFITDGKLKRKDS